jgi:GNAT superfamily N-acetyltransferase
MSAAQDHSPNEPPAIRRAGLADTRAIATVAVLGWRATYRGLMPDDFLDGLSIDAREAAWGEMLERDTDGGTPTWVAERGGRTVGFVSSGPPRDADMALPTAEVYALYVLPEHWRTGVGRRLLAIAVEHWRALGSAAMVLWVLEANAPARSFYEAMGWRPDGARQEIDFGSFAAVEVRYRTGLDVPQR